MSFLMKIILILLIAVLAVIGGVIALTAWAFNHQEVLMKRKAEWERKHYNSNRRSDNG